MLFPLPTLSAIALLLSGSGSSSSSFLPTNHPAQVHANPSTSSSSGRLRARQPTPNPLDFLDLKASSVYSSGRIPIDAGACAAGLDAGSLAFPHARFTNQLVGEINCTQRLVFKDVPLGYALTVIAVDLSGYAQLNRRSFLDRAEAGVAYFEVWTRSVARGSGFSLRLIIFSPTFLSRG